MIYWLDNFVPSEYLIYMLSYSKHNNLKSVPAKVDRSHKFYYPLSTLGRNFRKLRKNNPVLLLSSFAQVILGLFVVFATIIGQVKSAWLSFILCTLGSATTMLGTFFWYEMLRKKDDMDDLFKESVKRAINSQN